MEGEELHYCTVTVAPGGRLVSPAVWIWTTPSLGLLLDEEPDETEITNRDTHISALIGFLPPNVFNSANPYH